jgi:uncharacterized protein YsxB (DUF464 family)
MITCTFLKTGGHFIGFECSGHAGFAKAGRDIVCAGVSVLSYTCANALESVAHVLPEVEIDEKSGFLSLFLPQSLRTPEAEIILLTFRQGMKDLEEAYPKYVTLTEKIIMEE